LRNIYGLQPEVDLQFNLVVARIITRRRPMKSMNEFRRDHIRHILPARILAVASLVVGLVVLPAGQVAVAAETGTYVQVVSLLTNYTKSERGAETVTGGSSSGTVTTTQSSGGPFIEGSSGLFECILFAKRSAAGMDLEAPCTSTDTSGDKVFSVAKRRSGDVNSGSGEGRSELLGGTGKYSGLTGSCTYRVDFLPANRLVTISKCQWQKP
jgi:hypothetical protein